MLSEKSDVRSVSCRVHKFPRAGRGHRQANATGMMLQGWGVNDRLTPPKLRVLDSEYDIVRVRGKTDSQSY